VRRPAGNLLAKENDLAGGRRKNAGDEVEQRGLAGAVRADDGLALARRNFEGDLAYRREAPEAFRQRF
jgi:hypothetical protein